MKIGLDMDDVLAELVKEMVNFHNRVYKTSYSFEEHVNYDLTKVWNCTNEDVFKRVYEFYESEEMDKVVPLDGAYESLKILRQKHETVVITSRPHFMESKSRAWLKKHFPDLEFEVHFTNQFSPAHEKKMTKAQVCQKLGVKVMVDDAPHYVQNCAENGITALLFDRPWNQKFPETKNVHRVKNWVELAQKIQTLS